jgi:CHAT domain-containing protein
LRPSCRVDESIADLKKSDNGAVLVSNGGFGPRKLVVVPQGGLQILPIHAAFHEEAGMRPYVATDWSVRYVPSLHFLERSPRRTLADPDRYLAVGLNRYADVRLRPLKLAEAEAHELARFIDHRLTPNVLVGPNVRVLDAIGSAEVLHFACHGTWNADPEQSALQLWTDRPGMREELTAGFIERDLRFSSVRLTVLSACESGVFEHVFAPDEFAGLPGAFLWAGSGGVMSSLWAVNDLASFLLCSHFYRELRHEQMPEEALAAAQRWLRSLTAATMRTLHED